MWYARTIFSVTDIQRSLAYYGEMLGFEQDWTYEEDEEILVAQVSRGDFELILAGNLDHAGCGRVFVSLNRPELDSLEREIRDRAVAFDEIHWGYPSIRLRDPDGNELILPRET